MSGWVSASVETNYKNTDTNANSAGYGTRTQNVSDQYTDAFKNYKDSLNSSGFNATQQQGMNLLNTAATTGAAQNRQGMVNVNNEYTKSVIGLDKYANGDAHTATASTSANAPLINAKTGADYMDLYKDPYQKDVVDSALADYDAGVGAGYGALRAGTAGAFGNKRTGIAESNFADASARGRGTLSANLLSAGYNTRAGLGQQDANRTLSADTSNAGNMLNNNQFNAGLQTQNSQYNAGASDRADQRSMDAIKQQTGLDQQMLDNVFTVNGFDMEAAQSLFAAGSISQSQLSDLINYGAAYNGSSYTDNKTSNVNTNEFGIDAKAGFTGGV